MLKQINRPVYGSRLTLALIKSKLDEHGLIKTVEVHEVSETSKLGLGPFDVSFVAVSHSVPDALSVVLHTALGAVVITGDYKFDHTPIDGRITDVNTFARLGQQGVVALLADSTNAETPGSTASESIVGQAFHQIFAEAEGRVIVACFASHIHRVQQAIQIAHLHGRKFAVSGRSMQKNVNIARNLGYLDVPPDAMIKLADIDDYRPEELLILSTGSQGEPLSALNRMAFDDHPQVELNEGDTVVISAKPIPGNEVSVMTTVNRLLKSGATVIYGAGSGVHVSGHAAQEDMRMMLNLAAAAVLRADARRVPAPAHPRRPRARVGHRRRAHLHPRERRRARDRRRERRARRQGAHGHGLRGRLRDRRRRGPRAARPAAARRRRHPHRRRDRRRPDRGGRSRRPSSWRAASCTTTTVSRTSSRSAPWRSTASCSSWARSA